MRIHISAGGQPEDAGLEELTGVSVKDGHYFFEGMQFAVNSSQRECDVWFIVEDPARSPETKSVRTGITVFLSAESSYPPNYYYDRSGGQEFLRQFDQIYTFHDIFGANVKRDFPFLTWWINSNHGSVFGDSTRDYPWLLSATPPEKTRELSVFCSDTSFTPFHRLRLRLVSELKSHFGRRLEWFGNGIQPIEQKWEGLAPFKYTIAIENQQLPLLVSEKLYDPFLTVTFPFYVGAPEASEIFGSGSLSVLDPRDPRGAIRIIEETMASGTWERRQENLLDARSKVLSDFHLLRRIGKIASELAARPIGQRERTVYSKDTFVGSQRLPFTRLLARKVGNRLLHFAEQSSPSRR